MRYTQRRNLRLMLIIILSVWCISGIISIPPLFGWGKPSQFLRTTKICQVSANLKYQIYATLLSFYVPLLVMIIIYFHIYRAARKIKNRQVISAVQLSSPSDYVLQSGIYELDKSSSFCNKKGPKKWNYIKWKSRQKEKNKKNTKRISLTPSHLSEDSKLIAIKNPDNTNENMATIVSQPPNNNTRKTSRVTLNVSTIDEEDSNLYSKSMSKRFGRRLTEVNINSFLKIKKETKIKLI
jgi:hypothetical protein